MKITGYVVLDFCSDGKHNIHAFTEKKEAEQAFVSCISFYDDTLDAETIRNALEEQAWADYNGNNVYLEELGKTNPTLF